jgi:hypothetical protein
MAFHCHDSVAGAGRDRWSWRIVLNELMGPLEFEIFPKRVAKVVLVCIKLNQLNILANLDQGCQACMSED